MWSSQLTTGLSIRKVVVVAGVFCLAGALLFGGYLTYRYAALDRAVQAGELDHAADHLDAVPGLLAPVYTALAMDAVGKALEAGSGEPVDRLLRRVLSRDTWRAELQHTLVRELLTQRRYQLLARLVGTPAFLRYGTLELFHPLTPASASKLVTFLELVSMEPRDASAPGWEKTAGWYRECKSAWCVWRLGELLAEPDSPLVNLMTLDKHVREHRGDVPAELVGQSRTPAQQYLLATLSSRISPQRAFDLLRQAAEGGNAAAWWRLAEMAEPGTEDAEVLLQAAADAGHPLAVTLAAGRLFAAGEQEAGLAALERAALAGLDDLWWAVGKALLEGGSLRFPYGSWARGIRLDEDVVLRDTALPEDPALGLSWLRQGAERGDRYAAGLLYDLQARGEHGLDPDDHHALAKFALIEDRDKQRSINAINQAWKAVRKVRSSRPELMALAEQWQDLIEASADVEERWVEALRGRKYNEVLLAIAERHGRPVRFLNRLLTELKVEAAGHPAVEHLLGRLTREQVQRNPELLVYAAGLAPLSSVERLVGLGAPVSVSLSPGALKPGAVIPPGGGMPRVPLLAAVYHGRVQVVLYLLEQGADVNAEYRGANAVSLALERGYPRMARHFWDDSRFTHRTPALEAKLERVWAEWSDGLSFTFLDASGRELGPDTPPQHRQCARDHATGLTWVIPTQGAGPFAARRAIYGNSPEDTDCNEAYCPMSDFQAEVKAKPPCGIKAWRFPSSRELSTLVFPGYRQAFPAWPHPHLWVRIDDAHLGLARVDDLFGQQPRKSAVMSVWQYQPPTSAMLVTGELSRWPSPLEAPQDYELLQLAVPVPGFNASPSE